MDNRWIKFGALGLVLALAAGLRFADLSRSAVRSDEINFLNYVERNQSLVDLWKTPPWFNQIPLADSVPIVWARLTRQAGGTEALWRTAARSVGLAETRRVIAGDVGLVRTACASGTPRNLDGVVGAIAVGGGAWAVKTTSGLLMEGLPMICAWRVEWPTR